MELTTEQNILNVARNHFVKKGFAATRTQDIADEAGINKALLHYYFRTKDKLYQATVKATFEAVAPELALAFNKQGSIWERIESIVNGYIDTLSEHPEVPIFLMTELSQQRETFILELKNHTSVYPAIQAFIHDLTQEMETGTINNIDPLQLTLNIIGMSVFPFMAKPVFVNLFDVPEPAFASMMQQRKSIVINFIKNALTPKGHE